MKDNIRYLTILTMIFFFSLTVSAFANQTTSDDFSGAKKVLAEFMVEGMSCGGCVYTINKGLNSLAGIEKIDVDIPAELVTVIYNPRTLKNAQLIADAITDSGYPATLARQVAMGTNRDKTGSIPKQSSCGSGGGCGGCRCGGGGTRIQ